jgi:hypothetical protein
MTIPLYLAIVSWALLLTLGLLVILMYRQLARVFADKRPIRNLGPPLGSDARKFEYTRVSDNTVQSFLPGDGLPVLLAFVEPTCPACETLVDSLGRVAGGDEPSDLRVLLVISDPPDYLQISETFRLTKLEIARPPTNATRDGYNAIATPLLIAIDGAGIVRAARSVTQPDDVRAFMNAALSPFSGKTLAMHQHEGGGKNP